MTIAAAAPEPSKKCGTGAGFGEERVQSSGRLYRRNIAVAAQIQEMAIDVQQSVVTVDQNAERNAVEKSWREQLLRRRLGCIKRLFAYRVRCWFVRGVARFLVLTLAFAAAVFVR